MLAHCLERYDGNKKNGVIGNEKTAVIKMLLFPKLT